MAMGPQKIDRIDDRLSAFRSALATALATSVVADGFTPYSDRPDAELEARWYINVVWDAEGNYMAARGGAAKEGTTKVHLICHAMVDHDTPRAQLQAKEIALAEEIKEFVRTGVAGMTVVLDGIQGSRLLEHPYGWLVVFIELRPPQQNTI